MAYQTGVYSTPDQLLSAIRTFAAANGWTENSYAVDGTGHRLCINKGTVYLNFRSAVSEVLLPPSTLYSVNATSTTGVACAISTGYSAGAAWNAQPGAIAGNGYSAAFYLTSSGNYHLFANPSPDMLFCVVEVSPGVFNHIGGGMLEKYGSYTGGEWVSGSYFVDDNIYTANSNTNYMFPASWHQLAPLPFGPTTWHMNANTAIHAEFDSNVGIAPLTSNSTLPDTSWPANTPFVFGPFMQYSSLDTNHNPYTGGTFNVYWHAYSPVALNGISPLLPIQLYAYRSSGFFSPIGHPPHLRYLNIQNYAPGDIITIGSEQWKVFPGYRKDPANYSYYFGYAVKYLP